MRVLVFGSRNLGARHLNAMVETLAWAVREAAAEEKLVLVHGVGPRGKRPGAIGADMLSEVAALLAWRGRPRGVRRVPVAPQAGESWAQAAARRNLAMVAMKTELSLCFHTDERLGRGSLITAQALEANRPEGSRYLLVLLNEQGTILRKEQR